MTLSKHFRLLLLVLAAALGALDSWSSRHSLNPMGVSYLDMGDAFVRRDWQTALNGLWSPLYSLPLGLLVRVLKPSPSAEFPLVHFANFLIYLTALFAFGLFMRELIRWQSENRDSVSERRAIALPEWAMVALGYAVFIWCSLGLIKMATTAPDLLFSVFVYLAFAVLLRIRRGLRDWPSFFVLGLILGVGYLAKNPMLPLAPLFILVGLFFAGGLRKAGVRSAAAVLGILLTAGPFTIALSASKHRFTFGDSGKLNYLWHVNRLPAFHWQGDDARYGTPRHPTRRIFENPSVYEFASPLNATYPPWYDPSYWFEGANTQFDFSQQATALRRNLATYWEIFTYRSNLALLGAFLLLGYVGRRNSIRNLLSEWWLPILSFAAFVLYLPVHVEPRYVAPFIPAMWLVLFAALRLPITERSKKLIKYAALITAMLIIFAQTTRSLSSFRSAFAARHQQEFLQLQIADRLNRMGIQPGHSVGAINFDPFWLAVVHWARLAHVHIIAEIPNVDSNTFATADESRRREVIDAFAKTGATALVAEHVPKNVTLPGWEQIGDTDYYVLKLNLP